MKTIKIIILSALVTMMSNRNTLSAQDGMGADAPAGMFNVSYQMSLPLGGMKEWIDVGSFSGITFEGLGFLTDNVAVGGEISHNYSYQRFDEATYNFNTNSYEGAVTGVQYRSSRVVPLLVKGYYYPQPDAQIKPYAALGLGTVYMESVLLVGIHGLSETNWGFSSQLELGCNISFGGNIGMHLAAKYNYNSIYSTMNSEHNLSRLNFNGGITFLISD